jgi:hypothetical protein
MIEDHQDPLRDYEAAAMGGKLLYQTPQWNNLRGGIGFYTTHFIRDDISSMNREPRASNKNSRYVVGLVDTTDYDASSVSGLGEAYLRYSEGKNVLTLGRMKLDTPFVNPQDGRMIPTLVQGIWGKASPTEGWSAQGGYLNAFWNRSTPEWKKAESSLGYGYEMGMSSVAGSVPGNYYNHTDTQGLFVGSLRYEDAPTFRVELWHYYLENIFNLSYTEAHYHHHLDSAELSYGFQYFYQQQSGEGGNSENNAKSYMQEGEKSSGYGLKAALKYDHSKVTLAYNQTTDEGRFLFPREWGKEPFFTFQKRERSEGSGNSHAWLATWEYRFSHVGLNALEMMAGYGEYVKTDPKAWRYNKYGLPSYAQWNINLFYRFGGALKGLRGEYLMARKVARGETYQIPGSSEYNFIFRKNGMTIHNFILTYDF